MPNLADLSSLAALIPGLGPIGAAGSILAGLPHAHDFIVSQDGKRCGPVTHGEINLIATAGRIHASFEFADVGGKPRKIDGSRPIAQHAAGGDAITLDGVALPGTLVLAKHLQFGLPSKLRIEVEFRLQNGPVFRFDATVEETV